jgi:hypothetical protein
MNLQNKKGVDDEPMAHRRRMKNRSLFSRENHVNQAV